MNMRCTSCIILEAVQDSEVVTTDH